VSGLTLAVAQGHGHEILLAGGRDVAHSERTLLDTAPKRFPEVIKSHPTREENIGLVGQKLAHAQRTRIRRIVAVDQHHRCALRRGSLSRLLLFVSLGADRVVASPVNVGSGTVRCAHGVLPVPAPATAALLKDVPIYARGVRTELTTPTGALLITEFAGSYGPLPDMRVNRIGYGAGDKDFPDHPNVVRLLAGESVTNPALETIVSIECEIDDMNPQLFGPLMDRLYGAGALDVYYAAVQMKKNRPGTLVTVIAPPDRRDALAGILFTDTTTIGVRHREMLRERLERTIRTIDTPVGSIRFKIASRDGLIVNASPEFDDCVKAASERGLSIKEVQARAVKAWIDREG